jgi:tellurite resistance protein
MSWRKNENSPAKWYEAGQEAVIHNYIVPNGMIYVGNNLKSPTNSKDDACLINPFLLISPAEPWEYGDLMGYWPYYSEIPPKCRGAYLKWLATGRSEPKANIGYVFLFLYGLERRVFFDSQNERVYGEEKTAISEEVYRLLTIYGKNRSFNNYAVSFISMAYLIHNVNLNLLEKLEKNGNIDAALLRFRLALKATQGEPVSAQTAFQFLASNPEYGLRTPARRCPEEFQALFQLKYHKAFGDGITLKPGMTRLSLEYNAASPSLQGLIKYSPPNLSEPTNLKTSLKRIHKVAVETEDELEAYSRYLGRKDNSKDSLGALSLLPEVLLVEAVESLKARSYLREIAEKWPQLTPLRKILALFHQDTLKDFTKKDAEALTVLVEKLGYGLTPDPRYFGQIPELDGDVVVFPNGPGPDFQPSDVFQLMALIIWLGAIVSQSDGEVHPDEASTLKEFVNNDNQIKKREKNCLLAYLFWSLNTPQNATRLKTKLSGLGEPAQKTMSGILLAVALADGKIDLKDIKQLEKIYSALGLDKNQVIADLGSIASESNLVTATRDKPSSSYPLPPQRAEGGQRVALNEALIRVMERETAQVREILGKILTDDSEKEEEATNDAGPQTRTEGLDGPHEAFLRELITRANWERATLIEFCDAHGLMLDGALELINDWAYERANAPLIEDGDQVYVDLELFREITSG